MSKETGISMRNNKLTWLFIITLAIILMLIGQQLLQSEQFTDFTSETSSDSGVIEILEQPSPKVIPIPLSRNSTLTSSQPEMINRKLLSKIGSHRQGFERQMAQKSLVKDFKDKVKVEMDLPLNMEFIPMDMEDDVAGIYGMTVSGDKEFAMLATPRNVSVSQVVDYLKDATGALPLLKSHRLQPEKMQTLPAPASTGLKNLKIIPSKDANGKSAFAALAERKDGQGTYLFIMEAPTGYFDANEEGLEQMLKSIKTKP